MISAYLSSGETDKLLAGKETESHKKLFNRFTSNEIPYYNAKASPIEAFRIGAILEDRFYLTLDESYVPQKKVICSELDVCHATLDFAKVELNKVIDFKETKSCFYTDFLKLNMYRHEPYNLYIQYIKKNYRNNYNQVQFQLMCAGLSECELVYIEVKNYVDEDNLSRVILPEETISFRIKRDELVINKIKERANIFQQLKNYFNQK